MYVLHIHSKADGMFDRNIEKVLNYMNNKMLQ